MYQIAVERHFDAAHFLRNYGGKCENLHGHSFKIVIALNATKLNDIGLAYDFVILKRQLDEVLSRFDHTCLNDIPPFNKINPSSENIAATIFAELQPKLASASAVLAKVEVWESPQSQAIYTPD